MPRSLLPKTFHALGPCVGWLILCTIVVTGCDRRQHLGAPAPPPEAPAAPSAAPPIEAGEINFSEHVQPILAARCAVCHSCYDAPCQLKLSSRDGLDRGATKARVFEGTRTTAVPTTRLFIDAASTEQWRKKSFYSVRDSSEGDSLLARMLQLGRDNPLETGQPLPDNYDLGINRDLTCPTDAEFDRYVVEHPGEGMPYGTAPLTDTEYGTLAGWAGSGANFDERAIETLPSALAEISHWEDYLNRSGDPERLVARYIYEHWFLGHMYFEDRGPEQFYRLVRSSTPPGKPISEIPTRRPVDDPGTGDFYYRLRPLDQVFVRKTHFLLALSSARLAQIDELFFGGPAWKVDAMPSYRPAVATNPFVAFRSIPAAARYQFLLDDAKFYIENFVQGPSCRGQVALNVLQDHFYIAFLDPEYDLSVLDPKYMSRIAKSLSMPASKERPSSADAVLNRHHAARRTYVNLRNRRYDREDPKSAGLPLDAIWDGDGDNPAAFLTVMRHRDNASVRSGFRGGHPKTAMFMDYPILERLYYNLVANFDVYGNVGHQVATRIYMDYLRVEAEALYVSFLPQDVRRKLRKSWYKGARIKARASYPRFARDVQTQVSFTTANPGHELFDLLIADRPTAAGTPLDTINRCAAPPCDRADASPLEQQAERTLQNLANRLGGFARYFPELSFIQVRPSVTGEPIAYTVSRTTEHSNVAYLVGDQRRRDEDADTLAIFRGYEGAYPNYFFVVYDDDLLEFEAQALAIRSPRGFAALVDDFGVRRTNVGFWTLLDWFHADFAQRQPTAASLFDISRMEVDIEAKAVKEVLQEQLGVVGEEANTARKEVTKGVGESVQDIKKLLRRRDRKAR